MLAFDFGKNWCSYAERAIDPTKIEGARAHFKELFAGIPLAGKTFIDIGFGQGLALYLALEEGADVTGLDINQKCAEAAKITEKFFSSNKKPDLIVDSVLSEALIERLCSKGGFDVVYSWGVLHHTGDLKKAVQNAVRLVKPGGAVMLAIYNRHWSSPIWRVIKWLYNNVPAALQQLMVKAFYPLLYLATWATFGNPRNAPRGMDFSHDLTDWLGGYPYEYLSKEEILALVGPHFRLLKYLPPKVPTGNHELLLLNIPGAPPFL